MGMYTGLKCKVKIKEEYREDIVRIAIEEVTRSILPLTS